MCNKLSVRIKRRLLSSTIQTPGASSRWASSYVNRLNNGDDGRRRNWRTRPPISWAAFRSSGAGLRLYNSVLHNIDHLMFEYILNWQDLRLYLFPGPSWDLAGDKLGPCHDIFSRTKLGRVIGDKLGPFHHIQSPQLGPLLCFILDQTMHDK